MKTTKGSMIITWQWLHHLLSKQWHFDSCCAKIMSTDWKSIHTLAVCQSRISFGTLHRIQSLCQLLVPMPKAWETLSFSWGADFQLRFETNKKFKVEKIPNNLGLHVQQSKLKVMWTEAVMSLPPSHMLHEVDLTWCHPCLSASKSSQHPSASQGSEGARHLAEQHSLCLRRHWRKWVTCFLSSQTGCLPATL